jgi:hypothetical protein
MSPRFDAGRSRGFEPHAASLRSDLRLQAKGSPIRPTKGKSLGDFLPCASTACAEAVPRRRRFFFSDHLSAWPLGRHGPFKQAN